MIYNTIFHNNSTIYGVIIFVKSIPFYSIMDYIKTKEYAHFIKITSYVERPSESLTYMNYSLGKGLIELASI